MKKREHELLSIIIDRLKNYDLYERFINEVERDKKNMSKNSGKKAKNIKMVSL